MSRNIRGFVRERRSFLFLIIMLGIGVGLRAVRLYTAADWIMSISALLASLPSVIFVYKELRVKRYDPDIIALAALALAIYMGEGFVALCVAMVIIVRGVLAETARLRTMPSAGASPDSMADKARLMRGRKEIEISASEVHPGHRLMVRAGEMAPVDGHDKAGAFIAGGTILDHDVILRAAHDLSHSQHSRLAKIARSAFNSGSTFNRSTEQAAPFFILVCAVLAGAMWYISSDPARALAILIVATPSYLTLGVQLAFIKGIGHAFKKDILFRSGSALERLASIRTIFASRKIKLDITGITSISFTAKSSIGERIRQVEQFSKRPVAVAALNEEEAPILTAADVGIAVGTEAPLVDSANIIIKDGKLSSLQEAIVIARYTSNLAVSSVLVGFFISMALIILSVAGHLPLLAAVFSQLLVDTAAIAIALKPRK